MLRLRVVIFGLVFVLLAGSGAAEARKKSPPSPAKRVTTAQGQLRKLSRKSWAKTRRTAVLTVLASAGHNAKRVRRCTAARGIDRVRNALLTRRTWKKHAVPKTVRKKILPGLTAAEKSLLKKAGRRCAKPRKARKRTKPRRGGHGFTPVPGHHTVENDQGEGKHVTAGKYRPIKGIGATTGPVAGPRAGAARAPATGTPGRFFDAAPLGIFTSADVGVPTRTAEPQEPTTAVGRNVGWFTGNSEVAFSLNGGTNWTHLNPSTILPDPSGQPFCCDQLVSYSPQENLFVWVMQYWCPAGTTKPVSNNCNTAGTGSNTIRIAVASPEDIRKNSTNVGAAWTYWDFSPSFFGYPANTWFDRSDASVNASFLNWTVDVLRGGGTSRAVMSRIPLSQLKARGSLSVSWATDTLQRMTTTQGTGTSATYFVGAPTLSQTRIWEWAPNSGQLFEHDVDHDSIPINNGAANGSDGANWYSRWGIFPGAIESAAWKGNTLIVAQGTGRDQCTAKCNTGTPTTTHVFDHPAAYISRFGTTDWKLSSQRWLWNGTLNFGWPELAVSGDGSLGITFVAANDNQNPVPVAGFLDPDEQFVTFLGGSQAQTGGDYYSLRPGRTPSSFVIPIRNNEIDSDGVTRTHWRYAEYGHGAAPTSNPPSVFITSPAEGRTFNLGAPVAFNATVSDYEDGIVPENAIVWRVDGTTIGTGSRVVYSGSAAGAHTATVTATDGTGLSRTATVHYTVVRPPNPGSPSVAIISPDDNQTYYSDGDQGNGEYKNLQFTATASDPNGKPLTYTWTDTVTEFDQNTQMQVVTGPTVVSSSLSPLLTLHVTGHNCGYATHALHLTATNGTDSGSASISENVRTGVCVK